MLLQPLFRSMGYEVRRTTNDGLAADLDLPTRRVIAKVAPFTMTSPARIAALCSSVNYLVANNIPGAFVECGVWKGGSMMAVALELLRLGAGDRDLYLFDTFEGMTEPGSYDRKPNGEHATETMRIHQERGTKWCYSPLFEVKTNLESTGYDPARIRYVQGKVEQTLPFPTTGPLALLRLDTDWYESTRHELNVLFPLLVPGGVLIIDDYGAWEGARRAVDEYIKEQRLRLLLCRIDETGRMAVKLPSPGSRMQL